jgi:ATP-dependent Lhr-like helicase
MPLSPFHPLIAKWFRERIGDPTAAQRRGWEAIRRGAHTLIAAPTGSGKTLAAFLSSLDELFREGLERPLPDEVRVIYVSPLRALSADIHRNLAEPRREIRQLAAEAGLPDPHITAAVRSSDTPSAERAAMLRVPPHILVTTPESLYLLLTAERSRRMLATARTVIIDEIHSVIETRRGAHLALSLERLDHVAGRPLQRIGLSATQRPIEEVAGWLVGARPGTPLTNGHRCVIVDEGHARQLDLSLELPGSPLAAVMSNEVWEEVYDRLAQLIAEHRTTLVFVNTRRLAERAAKHLGERLGEAFVTAHHGSLSKAARLDAEERLKSGQLRALVATASLELGIDIGHVDLACQLGSPRRISTFLQRIGRSGHTVHGLPKGRLFPLTRDELVESAALFRSVRRGELDRVVIAERSLDVLAQQVVAETAAEPWDVDALYGLVRRSRPYTDLSREAFDGVVRMVSDGYVTRRGRRAALVHHDAVNGTIRGRRGARLLALTSGGAIPDNADYRVVLEPEGTFIGTVNEDFAVESMAGDVFQLGATSWRILRIERGVVRVADAHGEPPSLPFWLGEAPSRSTELSQGLAALRRELDACLDDREAAIAWLIDECGISRLAAAQVVDYLGEARRLLGVLPSDRVVVAERFFDEAGGMQLVVHSPFGSRVNRAWGLALRKRFCRQFNFELQAAATEDAVLLSLGPQHSFPLEDVFRFLQPETAEGILVQAMLDAPLFATRWRWNANISLAVPRFGQGRKVAPQIQRMQADDLLAAAFPDAAACLENIPGDRDIPDHPLVRQSITDCLYEAMDLDRFLGLLEDLRSGRVAFAGRDLPEPSPLSHEILNAAPYAFLDDAPLEERRTQAVYTRRGLEPGSAADLGALDAAAIRRVRDEAWPDVRDADELHDVLTVSAFLTAAEGLRGRDGVSWVPLFEELRRTGRAAAFGPFWVARERLPEFRVVFPGVTPAPDLPPLNGAIAPELELALRELLRGRLGITGPVTVPQVAVAMALTERQIEAAMVALEADGVVLRGQFTQDGVVEWCDRRLLARIHRYTLNRLRAEIEPVNTGDFMRFLLAWQHVEPDERMAGLEGLAAVVQQLGGYEVPAGAWETEVLGSRMREYDPQLLDMLSLTGRVMWGRLSPPAEVEGAGGNRGPRPIRTTPVGLFPRDDADLWLSLSGARQERESRLSTYARDVLEALDRRGASFLAELLSSTRLLPTQVEVALGELAATGLVTSDSYTGLRALLVPADKRRPILGRPRRRPVAFGVDSAGRWARLGSHDDVRADETVMRYARILLARYGVVFNRLLAHESLALPWRELLLVFRRLEARGDIRGGRFVAGVTGEQFALPEAVAQLRAVRRQAKPGTLVSISAVDPLNLTGFILPGDRVPAVAANRILFEDGVPVAVLVGGDATVLVDVTPARAAELLAATTRNPVSGALRARLGITGRTPPDFATRRARRSRQAVDGMAPEAASPPGPDPNLPNADPAGTGRPPARPRRAR